MFLPNKACFDQEASYWLSVSSGVKITQQGLLFLNSPVVFGGATYACPHTVGALCQYENYTFLPCTDTPRTRLTDADPPFEAFWTAESGCAKTPSMYDFDVMPCDLQRGAAIVWSEGIISVQHDLDMNYWANLCTMCIMVWLIVNLGETISLLLEVSTHSHHHYTVGLCIVLLAILTLSTPIGIWATQDDLALYFVTIAYVLAYAAYHLKNPNTVDIIIGCMMLVVARFYQTNETPYMATFIFLIATRLVHKLHYSVWGEAAVPGQVWCVIRHAFMVADVVVIAMLYWMSYIPSFRSPLQAHMYLVGIFYAAFCLGSFISLHVIEKRRRA